MRIFMDGPGIILTAPPAGKASRSVTGHPYYRKSRACKEVPADKLNLMRKHLLLLTFLALLFPVACKHEEKSGATGSSAQATYTCKCGATKTAPANQAPS
jgi:hypothetical protein